MPRLFALRGSPILWQGLLRWQRYIESLMHKYRRLLQDARPQWRFFVVILALTIVASMLAALQPWPLAWLTDHVLGGKPLPAPLQRVFETLSLEPTSARLLLFIVAS